MTHTTISIELEVRERIPPLFSPSPPPPPWLAGPLLRGDASTDPSCSDMAAPRETVWAEPLSDSSDSDGADLVGECCESNIRVFFRWNPLCAVVPLKRTLELVLSALCDPPHPTLPPPTPPPPPPPPPPPRKNESCSMETMTS